MSGIHTKPKMKPRKFADMTQEQIRKAILKKRECTTKAQIIVENLLQNKVTEEYFLECLVEINQEHFQDVVEERSIIHLCGYPLCPQPLSTENIPKQKYRISLKTNKVYDITARKNFCSNSCYKSAMYIKKQMLTSPLWFREYEEIPKFHLLPLDTVGILGEEIDVNFIEKVHVKERSNVNSNPVKELGKNELDKLELHDKVSEKSNNIENNVSLPSCASPQTKYNTQIENNTNQKTNKGLTNPLNIVGEVFEKQVEQNDCTSTSSITKEAKTTTRSAKTTISRKIPDIFIITKNVEKCLSEWLSLDTLLFLFGLEKVQQMFTDKGDYIKNYLNNYHNTILYQSNVYDQNELLCRKLNLLELKDKKLDSTLQKESQPLPDYSVLKEESKKIQLKVNAFLSGKTEIENDNVSEQEDNKDVILTQLPLVEKHAQNALRRRIVCQHLDKVIPDLMRSLGLLSLSITSDVHSLVKTFKLKADNIMFKPIQWTLIAIIVVKLLSIQNRELNLLMEQSSTRQHLQLLLLSYKLDGDYLNRLIMWLTDIDRLIEDMKFTSDSSK